MENQADQKSGPEGLLAATALASAIAASSCCVLPLLFMSVGISGAWIGTLMALGPYQPIFLAIAAASIAGGVWTVSRRKAVGCSGPDCGTAASRMTTRLALWLGLLVLIVAGSVEWWAKLLS